MARKNMTSLWGVHVLVRLVRVLGRRERQTLHTKMQHISSVPLNGAANLKRLAPLRLFAGAAEEMPFVQPLAQRLSRYAQSLALLHGECLRFGIAGLWFQVKLLTVHPADAAPLWLPVTDGMRSSAQGHGAPAEA